MQRAFLFSLTVCVAGLFRSHLVHGDYLGDYRTVDVIREYGYEAEEYSVVTEDGYILALTHIKSNSTKLPVLMMHGVLAASEQWVLKGPGQDLAFLLADEGHDVWLGDQRGNHYSRNHVKYNTSQSEYWDFSFHEAGMYDLPAFINTILNYTGSEQIHYVGHSMGTSVYYVMCSLRPEYNHLVRTAVHLAPVVYGLRKTLTSSLQLMLQNAEDIAGVLKKQNIHEFLPRNSRNQRMIDNVCSERNKFLCLFMVGQIYGPETYITNTTKLRNYLKSLQSGTSIKTMLHLTQIFRSKNFAQFDYGKKQNYEIYNDKDAPDYPLDKVTSPVALFYSDQDAFVDDSSIERLTRALPNVVITASIPNYNHIDVLFADNAPAVLFQSILKLLNV
uniref:Lipase n=1 Tax=Cuerna arida TaxID=1464854 RepID=A0A1B6GJH8_9HEMI